MQKNYMSTILICLSSRYTNIQFSSNDIFMIETILYLGGKILMLLPFICPRQVQQALNISGLTYLPFLFQVYVNHSCLVFTLLAFSERYVCRNL